LVWVRSGILVFCRLSQSRELRLAVSFSSLFFVVVVVVVVVDVVV